MADLNQRPESIARRSSQYMKAGKLLGTQAPTNMFTRERKRKKAPTSSATSTVRRVIKSLFGW